MDRNTFEIEIFALHDYFQRKRPSLSTIGQWFWLVKHIPDTAIDWICKWVQQEFDSLPRNIGKAFNAGWYQWQTDNNITAKDMVVLDGSTGRYKWHSDPDGTEYISLKEFKRRNPEYAKKLEGLGDRFGNILKGLPSHVLYDDTIPF